LNPVLCVPPHPVCRTPEFPNSLLSKCPTVRVTVNP
uniref:Tax protein n=1 Tax=Schistocephalus solidus TaxID=70667 RepID=A0A183TRU0_SCHSO